MRSVALGHMERRRTIASSVRPCLRVGDTWPNPCCPVAFDHANPWPYPATATSRFELRRGHELEGLAPSR